MDSRDSYCGMHSFPELQTTCQRRPDDDEDTLPIKKKLRTKLVDLFNRASISMMSPEDHMKVYLRIKPFTKDEDINQPCICDLCYIFQKCLVVAEDENTVVATAPEISHTYKSMKRGLGKSSHKFTFSRIFNDNTSQADFFNKTMLGMTKDFISGQNSLVFTYGVTSSGKTYTIQGKPQDAGILPRCLDVIFNSISGKQIPSSTLKPQMFTDVIRLSPEEVLADKGIKEKIMRMSVNDDTTVTTLLGDEMESVLSDTAASGSNACVDELLPEVENRDREALKVDVEDQGKILFGVWVSFAEIYNEQIFDLLQPIPHKKNARRPVLKICEDKNGNPYIKGLKEIQVDSADEAYRLLTIGQRNLQTACTRLNHCSSRSHCIFNIKIVRVLDKDDPHIARVSMLSLCDLAGSERYSKTQATGDRLKEAANINTSLMTLGRCIETLRHNQMHRDQQRLVPFRDSKLTRLLQNFFNGSGKAAMIVNVSQDATMFDETLHVFKFSAIAKQVKYIAKPPEPIKIPREKKVIPAAQRPSIAWETQEPSEKGKHVFRYAQNDPLPDDDDDDDDDNYTDDVENNEDNEENPNKMRAYIKTLQMRNERLIEMLHEEIANSESVETRVRQEVIQAMMKQVVNIEETYSTLLKETSEEAELLADERVKGIMEVYEKRLERIQRKVDEEDEWVSSILFHAEQVRVQEKDIKIAELEKEIADLKSKSAKNVDDSSDIGNSVLIETLSQKLQEVTEASKAKDSKIEELESLITEAGEVYNKHVKEISELRESSNQQRQKIEEFLSSVQSLEKQLKETTTNLETQRQSFGTKESEWKTTEDAWSTKFKSQEAIISSLHEECKELQEEIERLQDQMSQFDEQSRCCNDQESSLFEYRLHTSRNSSEANIETKSFSSLSAGKEEMSQMLAGKSTESPAVHDAEKAALKKQVAQLQEDLQKRCADLEASRKAKAEIEKEFMCFQNKNEEGQASHNKEKEILNSLVAQLREKCLEIEVYKQSKEEAEEKLKCCQSKNDQMCETIQHLDEQLRASELQSTENLDSESCSITNLVQKIEQKVPSLMNEDTEEDSYDSKIVFNSKRLASSVLNIPKAVGVSKSTTVTSPEHQLALKLKDTELANAALRNKLKREEEDFFRREQALIHGYSAEIENLKYEIAKLKSKINVPGSGRLQHGKRSTAAIDSSSSALICESSNSVDSKEATNTDDRQSIAVLSGELTSVHQQLLSLHVAYRKLQTSKGGNETNSFIQDVVMGSSGKHPYSQGAFQAEDNATDSVLQFEVEEYAIKLDEMKMKFLEQDEEIKTSKITLEKIKVQKSDLECELEKLVQKQIMEEDYLELKDILEKEKTIRKELKQNLDIAVASKQQLQSEVKELQDTIIRLKETSDNSSSAKNDTDEKLTEELNINKRSLQELMDKYSSLQQTSESLISERDQYKQTAEQLNQELRSKNKQKQQEESELQASRYQTEQLIESLKQSLIKQQECCTDLEAKLQAALIEVDTFKGKLNNYADESETWKEKAHSAEQTYRNLTQVLENVTAGKSDLENELKLVKNKLAAKEEAMSRQEKNFNNQLVTLKQQYCSEGESSAETISKLHLLIEDLKTQLKTKKTELENLEHQHQEAEAEVSQKLIMYEREKKMAERKIAEAKEKEQELQLKCQGLARIKQLEQQLHEQLRTAANTIRKHSEKTCELTKELVSKNLELDQLRKELASLKTNNKIVANLESKIAELEQKLHTQKDIQDYCEKIKILKTCLTEAEETMEQQEKIMNKQDDELESLKTELKTVISKKEQSDIMLTRKELELANLNKEVSKLDNEMKTLLQWECKTLESEQREKLSNDQLQKSNTAKEMLKEKIQRFESEKQYLQEKLENAEKLLEKQKKDQYELEEKVNRTEKQKGDLETEVQNLTSKKDAMEQQLEKIQQQRLRDLELSSQMSTQLENLKKELVKDATNESKLNQSHEKEKIILHKELDKLKGDLQSKKMELAKLQETLSATEEIQKSREKDLEKQERINSRNREEMENWKQERDSCVNKLEQLINKRQLENKQLSLENEQLKRDNADLAKNISNISTMKDSVIAELKKTNNTLSIQLARVQGMSPPPKMATPDNSMFNRMEFFEDLDTTGHVEIDATPPIAAKKCRKRQASIRQSQLSQSSADAEVINAAVCKSLKPIEEQNENSSQSPSGILSAKGKVAEIACGVIATISPLTRSAKRHKESKQKKSTQAPFDLASFVATDEAPNENVHPYGTRQSARLKKSKH